MKKAPSLVVSIFHACSDYIFSDSRMGRFPVQEYLIPPNVLLCPVDEVANDPA